MDDNERQKMLEDLSAELADRGKLIEAGWISLQRLAVPADAPPEQVKAMRWAFMAGAQHLFASIMTILEPDAEPTEKDLERMDLIHDELEVFRKEVMGEAETKGTA